MSKKLLFDVLDHKKTDRLPWVPFAGIHAGKLTDYNAIEVLTDEDKLMESLLKVNELYSPDGQPVLFDLQIEAEILGCTLEWAEKAPPSVKSHPLKENKIIPDHIPNIEEGRLPITINVMKKMKAEVGENTALYGLICGAFTLASHLRGSDIFMDMFLDPQYVHDLLKYCVEVNKQISKYYIDAGMDIIAVVDPLVSQISPAHFEEFLLEPFSDIFKYIREQKVYSSFFVCGNATKNIDIMCQSNPDSISVDENIDMTVAKPICDKYNITLGGNIPLTSFMLHGTQEDNMKYVLELMDSLDHHNLIIAPGCDMPYDVPPKNVIAIQQTIINPDVSRKIIENYTAVEEDIEIVLPDYDNLDKPLMEVFTLDSDTCAACTYMLKAAMEAKEYFGDAIDMVEYKMLHKETIARMKVKGVKNLPCIYINGDLYYDSIIPGKDELTALVEKIMKEKHDK